MKRGFGIALRATSVHAVYVRRGRVVWRDAESFGERADLRAAVERVLERAPRKRRDRAVVALGPRWAQTKRVVGLSESAAPRAATDVIRANCAAFFLHPSPLLVADACRAADGAVWCAAFDKGVVDDVVHALEQHHLRASVVMPSVAALARHRAGEWSFVDGGDSLLITSERGHITSCRRDFAARTSVEVHDEAAAALAAAERRRTPLCWRPSEKPRRAARRRGVLAAAAVFACSALVAAAIAPGVRAERFAVRMERELDARRVVASKAAALRAEIARSADFAAKVAAVRRQQGETTLLVADIADALPESTALTTLHVDSIEGSLSVLGARAEELQAELEAASRVLSPRLVGSVARETGVSSGLERATVRFRRRTPIASRPIPKRR